MLSPEIWEDAQFGTLSPQARLLFVGMISNADDQGIGEASIPLLKRLVFGFDDYTADQVSQWFSEIDKKMRSVKVYQSDGRQYYQLVNWHDYQTINRPKPSRFPSPPLSDDQISNHPDRFVEIIRSYEQIWGTINPKIVTELEDLVGDWRAHIEKLPQGSGDKNVDPIDAVLEAIRVSVRAVSRPNLNYISAVLNGWIDRGFGVAPDYKKEKRDDGLPPVTEGYTKEELKDA